MSATSVTTSHTDRTLRYTGTGWGRRQALRGLALAALGGVLPLHAAPKGLPAHFVPWVMTFRRERDGRAVSGRLVKVKGHELDVRVEGQAFRLDARELAADSRKRADFLQVRGLVEPMPLPDERARDVASVGLKCWRYRRPDAVDLPFLLHEPPDSLRGGRREYPLVMFLHGNGGRGADGYGNYSDGGKAPQPLLSQDFQQRLPAYVFIPQSAEQSLWSNATYFYPQQPLLRAVQCIDVLKARYGLPIDMRKLYVTGLSSGGVGCYEALAKFPGKFAAAVPIACNHDAEVFYRENVANVWYFVNQGDKSVHFGTLDQLAAHFRGLRAEHRITLLNGRGHNAWSEVYGNLEFRQWLARQQLAREMYPTDTTVWLDDKEEQQDAARERRLG